ncbi:MAG: hypothetical protein LBN00_10765 [Oscillospiraceae bacterium]|jgi:hypothetical protein|nr:hypothetical protein [Oscillospiraceae bacterium]
MKVLNGIAFLVILITISYIFPHLIIKLLTHLHSKVNPQYTIDKEKNKRSANALGAFFDLICMIGYPMLQLLGSKDRAASIAELKDNFLGLSLLLLVTSAVVLIIGFTNYKKRAFGIDPTEAQKKYKQMLHGSCISVFGAIVLFLISRFVG